MKTMNALCYLEPNRVEWQQMDAPALLNSEDVLVEPVAVAACDLDPVIARGETPFPGPFVMGHEFVGRVADLGDSVVSFNEGDLVLASFQPSCGGCRACGLGHTASCAQVPATSMYGVGPVSGDWSGAFSDLIRIPFAEFNLMKLPAGIKPEAAAPASDNIADGYRAVAPALAQIPEASVLITGPGSISLYALLWAQVLGANRITYAAPAGTSLDVARRLGADTLKCESWPERFDTHEVTINTAAHPSAWYALLDSTAPQGMAANCSILFGKDVRLSFQKLYMKGITMHTGRVNSAALMGEMLTAIADGVFDPLQIEPTIVDMESVGDLLPDFSGSKLIAIRD